MNDIHKIITENLQNILTHRRWLHAHPELSGNEINTSAYIADALREMGLNPIENLGGYGVAAIIQGSKHGKCVGLRADMDALPLEEQTGLPFSSVNHGVMHACGHDCHTAILLGAAYVLNQLKDRFNGAVKLIFQPSEENPMDSGAQKMIQDGVLLHPKVDAVFGLHLWPQYSCGQIAIRNGAMMAASDRIFITVKGKNSHASTPEQGQDAIVMAANLISQLQGVVSRQISPLDSAVITIGKINGGQRYNIIADEVRLEGTCRYLNPELSEFLPKKIEQLVRGVTDAMGGEYEYSYIKGYLPTVNDPSLFTIVRNSAEDVLGSKGVIVPENSAMASEDFSYYCREVPSAFFWLGCSNANEMHSSVPLHHSSFNPTEDALPIGVEIMVKSALKYLDA